MFHILRVSEGHMDRVMMICLQQVPGVVRDDVEVLTDRPSKDCGCEHQHHERVKLFPRDFYDIGCAQRKAKSL